VLTLESHRTYAVSIGCVLWRRFFGKPLPPARWSLGRLGVLCNAFSVLYLLFIFCMDYFPLAVNPTVKSMNWVRKQRAQNFACRSRIADFLK
jgi:hypothetical protein